MKFLLIASLTLGTFAYAVEYYRNDGLTLPETLEGKSNKAGQVGPTTSRSGILNSSEVTPDEINPSVNPPPSSDKELIEGTTLAAPKERRRDLKPGGLPPELIEAQEEGPLDYSTTPKKRVRSGDEQDK